MCPGLLPDKVMDLNKLLKYLLKSHCKELSSWKYELWGLQEKAILSCLLHVLLSHHQERDFSSTWDWPQFAISKKKENIPAHHSSAPDHLGCSLLDQLFCSHSSTLLCSLHLISLTQHRDGPIAPSLTQCSSLILVQTAVKIHARKL